MRGNLSKRQAFRVGRAAQLRAAGNSWQAIAQLLGCRPQTCQRWPIQYPEWWARVYRRTEEERYRATWELCEQKLREFLRSPEAKYRRWAAKSILQVARRDPGVLSPAAVAEAELVYAAEAQLRVIRVTVNEAAREISPQLGDRSDGD